MNILALDTESQTWNKGNPYDSRNKLVCYSWANQIGDNYYNDAALWTDPAGCQYIVDHSNLVVGFNFKFDYHHLSKEGVDLSKSTLWDVQIAEFILSNQQNRFPSLNQTCEKYGIPIKLDLVKEEFWERKCSCHVSIVRRLVNIMLKAFVGDVIAENMNALTVLNEMLINVPGEQQIQTAMRLLKHGEMRNCVLVLKHRLEHDDQKKGENTTSQILSMINSWLEHVAQFAEILNDSVLTTTIKQEKCGICCASAVTQLWDILNNQIGWNEHTHTCRPIPVNTDAIPWPVLRDYAAHDAKVTLECYHAQRKLMTPKQVRLCQLMCMDLHILQSMEASGLPFDEQLCAKRAQEVDDQISKIKTKLSAIYPHVPLNFASNDHLSAFLYGGVVKEDGKEHIGFYKTGEKKGQPKYKNVIIEHQLPRLFQPLKGSELQKEGMFATDESTLRKLKGKKSLVNLILELSKLEKLNGTYYNGLVKLRKEMHWPEGLLHGQFNQCVAQTGRLSSSRPNLQNFASELQDVFVSKYND